MKLNIDLGKYVITGTKHDLILSEKKKVTDEKSKNFGNEVLVRCGYYSKFEHLVKELFHREILASEAQSFQDLQQHIETLAYANMGELHLTCLSEPMGDAVIPLYAAPQAPVSVPVALNRLRSIVADPRALPRRKEWISGQQYSYVLLENVEAMVDDACRAAMLQGSQPVSNRDELRDAVETIRNSGIAIDAEKILAERDALNTPDCWCRTCRPITLTDMRFVVCPECGNKRCPHANDHRNDCTGSNEPGQAGSAYPAAPQQEAE